MQLPYFHLQDGSQAQFYTLMCDSFQSLPIWILGLYIYDIFGFPKAPNPALFSLDLKGNFSLL